MALFAVWRFGLQLRRLAEDRGGLEAGCFFLCIPKAKGPGRQTSRHRVVEISIRCLVYIFTRVVRGLWLGDRIPELSKKGMGWDGMGGPEYLAEIQPAAFPGPCTSHPAPLFKVAGLKM